MIDPKKTYRTRDGRDVRIYAVDGNMPYVVHGAIKYDCGWDTVRWTGDGVYDLEDTVPDFLDLIEVKPRIKREVWVNVYKTATLYGIYQDKGTADLNASAARIACVKLTIDCEEGDGL